MERGSHGRLFLASLYGFDGPASEFLRVGEPGAGSRLAFVIGNALDEKPEPDRRSGSVAREKAALEALGYRAEELDLRVLTGPQEASERLAECSLVWVLGGNAFVLAREMNRVGFRETMLPYWEAGTLTYGGYSAGAILAGPDLLGFDFMDPPPPGGTTDVETLGLYPRRIIPHWVAPNLDVSIAYKGKAFYEASGLAYETLRNGEVILVENRIATLVKHHRQADDSG